MNDDVDTDPTTHMRYSVVVPYSTKGKMREHVSGSHASREHPFGNRWKHGRISCPICGYPLANDIDENGIFRGLVCMSAGEENGKTHGNRSRRRCPNYGLIVYKNKQEAMMAQWGKVEIRTGDERKGMSSVGVSYGMKELKGQ